MSPKLKPLLLPQLVEERRQRESLSDSEMDLSSSFQTQNSSASDLPSPITPTFSTRGHYRYPSSTSSLDSTYHSSIVDSPSSPTFNGKAGKRSLPDVQEEPQEREEELDQADDFLYYGLCDDSTMAHSSVHLSSKSLDYDLADGFFSDGECSAAPRSKKRRGNESTFNGLASRFGTRFPSLSRKFRLRKGVSSASLASDGFRDSMTTSSRASSISNSIHQGHDTSFDSQFPPTPTRSIYGRDETTVAPISIDIERANKDVTDLEETFATTPLLPPLMTDINTKQTPFQSPLQSPSVAEPKDPFPTSGTATPIDPSAHAGIPSPPLSTKPSIASLLPSLARPSQNIPTSEIPSIPLSDLSAQTDEWALKLGHANFTIHPTPYIPAESTLSTLRQLRADWDLARCNYTKHLVRTGEHYGTTSSTYRLTEEKWAATDAIWRANNDIAISKTAESGNEALKGLESEYRVIGGSAGRGAVTKIPSLNDPRGEGKFPSLGDGEIVGPMVKGIAASPALAAGGNGAGLKRSVSKKARMLKFIADKFPAGLVGRN